MRVLFPSFDLPDSHTCDHLLFCYALLAAWPYAARYFPIWFAAPLPWRDVGITPFHPNLSSFTVPHPHMAGPTPRTRTPTPTYRWHAWTFDPSHPILRLKAQRKVGPTTTRWREKAALVVVMMPARPTTLLGTWYFGGDLVLVGYRFSVGGGRKDGSAAHATLFYLQLLYGNCSSATTGAYRNACLPCPSSTRFLRLVLQRNLTHQYVERWTHELICEPSLSFLGQEQKKELTPVLAAGERLP